MVNQTRINNYVMVNLVLSFRTVFTFIIASLICLVNSNLIFAESEKSIQVIIDHLKIDADLYDFPIAVDISASGGTNGFDASGVFDELQGDFQKLVVTDDNDNKLYTEVEYWDAINKKAVLHIKVPQISATQNTQIKISYDPTQADNSGYIGGTGSPAAQEVWDDAFDGVYHLSQNPTGGGASVLDSTSNQYHGTPEGGMTAADLVGGPVGKALEFDGIDDSILLSSHTNGFYSSSGSIEMIFKIRAADAGTYMSLIGGGEANATTDLVFISANGSITSSYSDESIGFLHKLDDVNDLRFYVREGESHYADDNWHYIGVRVADLVGSSMMVDGATKPVSYSHGNSSIDDAFLNTNPFNTMAIGRRTSPVSSANLKGFISEVRISRGNRSDAWLKATHLTLMDNLVRIDEWDTDGDGISDQDEISIYRTNPDAADTDDDGLADGAELSYWGNQWNNDFDNDGVPNLIDADSDNDSFLDLEEIDRGYNPADAASHLPNHNKMITAIIDHTKIDQDLTDFPLHLYLSDFCGIGGFNADSVFEELQSDFNALTITDALYNRLNTEIVYWDATQKKAELYVLLPLVKADQNTVLYIYFDPNNSDNSDYIGTTNSTAAGSVWNSKFRAVYHFSQSPVNNTVSIWDSTNYLNHLAPGGSMNSADLVETNSALGIAFDGNNDYLHCDHDSSLQLSSFSISAFIKLDQLGGGQAIVNKEFTRSDKISTNNSNYEFRIDEDKVLIRFEDAQGKDVYLRSSQTIQADQWYHVVGTYQSSNRNMKLYINGQFDSSRVAGYIPNTNNFEDLRIGIIYGNYGWELPFKGIIDELLITGNVLSESFIKASYHAISDNLITYEDDDDLDGIPDYVETSVYGTDPKSADTDGDGLDDGIELNFWADDWNLDPDGDGHLNLVDADADNDNLLDGEEINIHGTDPALADTDSDGVTDDVEVKLGYSATNSSSCPLVVYEDAEDEQTLGWAVYDGPAAGVTFSNRFDDKIGSRAIDIFRDGTQGLWLTKDNGIHWNDQELSVISWRMQFAETFLVYIDVQTNFGHRYMQYSPMNYDPLGTGEYVIHGLGLDAVDGAWHTIVRDLQADLEEAQPGGQILAVNRFLIRGSGRLDEIRLMDIGWDSDSDGISDFEEVNIYELDPVRVDTDADGITDGEEIDIYATNPTMADTDDDGMSDGEELAFWDLLWNQDTDGDGLHNLVDADADNDGAVDGDEINQNFDPANPDNRPATIYEDAQDGLTLGWGVYDGPVGGVQFSNVFDDQLQSQVIEINRDGTQGVRLLKKDGQPWGNPGQFVIGWRMQFAGAVLIYIDVETTAGHRYMQYGPLDTDPLGAGEYVVHGIGSDAVDGRWHTYVRDLQADLEEAQPGEQIVEVNGFWIRGSGRLDDICLMDRSWDNDGDGISDFEEVNIYELDPVLVDTDADGITDGQEIDIYATDPTRADTDDDGMSDGEELAFWDLLWNQDTDGDGLHNLVDADSDNDGAVDGDEIDQNFDPASPDARPATMYEDAQDGQTLGWGVYDGPVGGVQFSNVFDDQLQSNVIDINRDGTQGMRLLKKDGQPWCNPGQFVVGWRMKFTYSVLVYIDVETTAGHRYMQYSPMDYDLLGQGEYVIHGIGSDALDGRWHTYVRDLQADLEEAQPGERIVEVNGFWIRGSGRLDDICLMDHAWDSDGDGLVDFEEANTYGTNTALIDSDQDGFSDAAELAYWGAEWNSDMDADGLDNLNDADADNDGAPDGFEIEFGFDPRDSNSFPVAESDIGDLELGLSKDEQQGGGGLVGETVRILNGNMIEHRPDVSFGSPNSRGLSFGATYNSRSNVSNMLGYGWSHTYSATLKPAFIENGISYLKIIDETGRAVYFKKASPGVFSGAYQEKSIVKNHTGEFVWYRLDGSRIGFSPAGKLTWIEDAKSNRLNLAYDTQGRLETVNDAATGRILTFNYNPNSKLESIAGPVTDAVSDGIWVVYGYTADNLTSVTYADGSGFTYMYEDPNDPHNLTAKRNKADHLIGTWDYDDQDRCDNKTSVNGNGVSIEYVSDSTVQVTDAYETQRSYTISEFDNLKRLTAVSGLPLAPYSSSNAVRWQYDDALNLVEIEYGGGTVSQFQDFDARSNPDTVILAVGTPVARSLVYTYHPEINAVLTRSQASVLGDGSKETIWDYDSDGNDIPNENPVRLISRIIEKGFTRDAAGAIVPYEYITAFTYNHNGQVESIDGPRPGAGDTTSFGYDASSGNLLSITKPIVGATVFSEYDAAGQVGQVTDVNGQTEQYDYDGRGRVTGVHHLADGSSRSFQYNNAGLPESTTDEDTVGRAFIYYTTSGRLQQKLDDDNNYLAYLYDDQGNRTEKSKYGADNVRTSWNRWDYQHPTYPGMLWKQINFDESYTEYGYDGAGNVTWVKDPEDNTTAYSYDALNRLLSVTQPGNIITRYGFNALGGLVSVTDANSNETIFVYDDMGRMVSTTSPDTGTTTYVYDEAGNATRKTDAKGVTVEYIYDDLNRLTNANYPDASENVTYSYDAGTNAKGRRTGIVDESGSTTFAYDDRGRLTAKTSLVDDISYTIERGFTPAGKLESFIYPSGRRIDITRFGSGETHRGKLKTMTTTFAGNEVTLADVQNYGPFGPPNELTNGAGGIVNNQSSACDCVEIANPGQPLEQQFFYDHNRNLEQIIGTNAPWLNQDYTYDTLNRLTQANGPYGDYAFTYDNVGNRQTRTANGKTATYEYVPDTNRLSKVIDPEGTIDYNYDANGNVVAIGSRILVYNQNNRLIRVEEGADMLGTYVYNALGQRVKKTADSQSTYFHYDFDGNIIAESAPDGSLKYEYIYWSGSRTAMVDVESGALYYYQNDQLGTPQMLVDSANMLVWEATYTPFGEALVNPASEVVNNFRFAGQYYDSETGLHYNYHRYYDPEAGRYLRPDPIGMLGGVNFFTFATNNPINSVDPKGLFDSSYLKDTLISGARLTAHSFFQPGFEAAGGIWTIAETSESVFQRSADNNWEQASYGEIEDFVVHVVAFGVAEVAELNLWALELLARGTEESFRDCQEGKNDLSEFLQKYRLKASDTSNILRDLINQFIVGGNKRETWITMSRRMNSDYGSINKSIITEEYGSLLYNLRKMSQ